MATDNFRVLLIVEDTFAQQASLDLQQAGYFPVIEPNIDLGLQKFINIEPAMVILDRVFSGELGIKFCHQLRNMGSRVPVLMLVEEETIEERLACLEAGADDYLLKPYNKDYLLNLARLYLEPAQEPKEQLRFGELILDLATRQIIRNEQTIDLTMKEFELLKYLMSNPGKVLTREEIIENVWGYDYRGESNVIEVYIRYLRIKVELKGQKRLIQTVRGVGYVLKES
ncbi:Response regulator MprA [Hyella patelloides LEGE 07179]|uniref:Response regulator MprA n=1 Tax=Hyella patelloides LEGE 07179 TaxID=945734 RepID=A0A563W3N8_9CYAN|nr:response regulator transcription factor [Hyella patelloides]VEP18257.1 Response regulator MprA [Hyella patelloides LEGE 07179]